MNPLSVISFLAALPYSKSVQLQRGERKLSAEILLRAGPAPSLCSPQWKQKVPHK